MKKAGACAPAFSFCSRGLRSAAPADQRPARSDHAGRERDLEGLAEQEGLRAIGEGLGQADAAQIGRDTSELQSH